MADVAGDGARSRAFGGGFGRAAAAVAAAIALLAVGAAPSAAAEDPALALSVTSAAEGDPITVTLTGCEGVTPRIDRIPRPIAQSPEPPVPLTIVEVSPGTWESVGETAAVDDTYYRGTCASGATSPVVRVDVEVQVMFPTPLINPTPGRIDGVWGTDCEPGGIAEVYFRVGEWSIVRLATPDPSGDWYVPAPELTRDGVVVVIARCGGFVYQQLAWSYDNRPTPFEGQGDTFAGVVPGTDEIVGISCRPVAVQSVGSDAVVPLGGESVGTYTWSFRDRVRSVEDQIYLQDCPGGVHGPEAVRVDIEAPHLALRSVPVGSSAAPSTLQGTDCPSGTEAAVTVVGGGEEHHLVRPIDPLYGDWEIELADLPEARPLAVAASCGSVTYERLQVGEGEVVGPSTAPPGGAAPAEAVPGTPAYTG